MPKPQPRLSAQAKRQMRIYAAWLVAPLSNGGGGITYDQLGKYLGRSAGWAHHAAHGKWEAIAPTSNHAAMLRALYHFGMIYHSATAAQAQTIDDLRDLLGQAIAKADKLAMLYARRARKEQP